MFLQTNWNLSRIPIQYKFARKLQDKHIKFVYTQKRSAEIYKLDAEADTIALTEQANNKSMQ